MHRTSWGLYVICYHAMLKRQLAEIGGGIFLKEIASVATST